MERGHILESQEKVLYALEHLVVVRVVAIGHGTRRVGI